MEENIIMVPGSGTKVIVRDVKQEIETAFLDYSMSVIVARALPDVRDGLKPVHRRILYTMHERGNDPQHPYRKSADTVGAVLGSYHPHGDASVYDAMVRLAQDFSLRYPLVDGQGNFGSVDGDPPAAYRYTEARMSKMACEMLTDIEKDTIDWDPNFDENKKEPHVLPSRFPNLLVNGSQGIAVGMATNIPPHNLREIVNGMVALMDDPEIDLAGLMEYVKGPDFPTGGIIMGRSGIRAAYATGRGKITLRGRAEIIEKKNGRYEILISEIPYMVNKTRLIESIADLVKDKRIEGISDLNDESSSRTGMKIVIEIKKDANPQVVLNQLYRFTQLQDTVGVIMLALDDGVQGMTQKDDDFTEELFVGSTHDYMLFMTNQGRVYRLKGYQVPEGSRTAKGSHIVNLLQLQEGEKVTLMLQQKAGVDEDNTYATMVTKQGLIKRTPLSQFRNIRKMGLIAIALNEGDSLVWSHLTKGDDEIIVATHDGAAIRFTEDGARSMGRTGHGVRVIKLREGDYVVGAGVCRPGANVLTISEEGKGRRSRIDDYRITKRGGLGIRNYSNGNVAGIKIVDDTDDLILISQNGILIRIHAADINVQSRYGSGVRVMRLVEDDKVAVVARVDRDNDAETAKIEDTGETDPTPEELAAIEAEELAQEAAEDAAPENDTEE